MPNVSDSVQDEIVKLKKEYVMLSPYQKLFFPSAISQVLNQYNDEEPTLQQVWAICHVFLNQAWFFHLWFFDSLFDFSGSSLMRAIQRLHKNHLFFGEEGRANFDAVAGHRYPGDLADALVLLHHEGLLTGDKGARNRHVLAKREKNSWHLAAAIQTLHKKGLLVGEAGEANYQAVTQNACFPPHRVESLSTLHAVGLLNQMNREAVVKHPLSWAVTSALQHLERAHLLHGDMGQANFNLALEHPEPAYLASMLISLHGAGLLNNGQQQSNFNAIVQHPNLMMLVRAFDGLLQQNIRTQQPTPANQAIFNGLMAHSSLFFNDIVIAIWDRLPRCLLTLDRFHQMIELAEHYGTNLHAGRVALVTWVNNLLDIGVEEHLNAAQSTHTASVHASVSQSAEKLWSRYGVRLSSSGLSNVMEAIFFWCATLRSDLIKESAVKRCLLRLKGNNYNHGHLDDVSKVSTQQLLALTWLAIHDEKQRMGALLDAKILLIEGLYEIQRGYNLSAVNVDDGTEDRPICCGGTFNKLMEKLSGVHPDVEVVFITQQLANNKFPVVVNEEVVNYAKSLGDLTDNKRDEIKRLLEEGSLSQPVWDAILPKVTQRIFGEFGSLYDNKMTSEAFQSFMSTGMEVALNKTTLSVLQAIMSPSLHAFVFFQPASSLGEISEMPASPSLK